ncbi:alpha/beta fold hydrolase [Burkholderia pseudomallei]
MPNVERLQQRARCAMHRCVSIPYISRCRLYRRVRRACGTPGFACCTCRIRHAPRWQARLISRYVGDNVARRFHRSARESGNHDDCRRLLRHAHRFRAFARTPLTDSLPSDLIDMPFVTIDGQPLHYQIRGAGAPVLFGHSYLWDSSMWEPQLDALSKSYRVIAPDLWGHGRSGPLPDGTRSLDDLARQMSELLDHLDIDTCSIVGLSVGGMWAVPLAHRAPQRIDRLVLMDTYVGVEPDATRNQYFQMLEAIDAQGAIPAPLLDAIVPIFFRPGIDPASELPTGFRRAAGVHDRAAARLGDTARQDHVRPRRRARATERAAGGPHARDVRRERRRAAARGSRRNRGAHRLRKGVRAECRAYLESRESGIRHAGAERLARARRGPCVTDARSTVEA